MRERAEQRALVGPNVALAGNSNVDRADGAIVRHEWNRGGALHVSRSLAARSGYRARRSAAVPG